MSVLARGPPSCVMGVGQGRRTCPQDIVCSHRHPCRIGRAGFTRPRTHKETESARSEVWLQVSQLVRPRETGLLDASTGPRLVCGCWAHARPDPASRERAPGCHVCLTFQTKDAGGLVLVPIATQREAWARPLLTPLRAGLACLGPDCRRIQACWCWPR